MDFNTLAAECAPLVSTQTMAAIVKTESQFKPFAININGDVVLERQPETKEEAVVTANWLIDNDYNIDMGLGQVNSKNLTWTKLSVADAFDPCKNLGASATILKSNYVSASKKMPDQQAALQAAISAYNTGSFTRGFANGYVQKVVANATHATEKIPSIATQQSVIPPIALKAKAKQGKAKPKKVVKVKRKSSLLIDMGGQNEDMVKSMQADDNKKEIELEHKAEVLMAIDSPNMNKIDVPKPDIMVY